MPATPINRFHNPPSNPFGPAPSSSDHSMPRPKSSSSLPYARPSIPAGTCPIPSPQHPIMVALSGWPEPVFIAESKEVMRRRSRAGTPVLAPLTSGTGDGVDLSSLPPSYGGGRAPIRDGMRSRESSPYPISSTRSTRTSPATSRPSSPTPSHHPYPGPPLPKGYHDPRYGPGAALHNRALRVVPAWSSSSGSKSYEQNVNVGMRIPAGQRGEGVLVMRAVPDVYPPPGMVLAGGGVAKEVYPRDPNNAMLWGSNATVHSNGNGKTSPPLQQDPKDEPM